jgi:hypothetical protein
VSVAVSWWRYLFDWKHRREVRRYLDKLAQRTVERIPLAELQRMHHELAVYGRTEVRQPADDREAA